MPLDLRLDFTNRAARRLRGVVPVFIEQKPDVVNLVFRHIFLGGISGDGQRGCKAPGIAEREGVCGTAAVGESRQVHPVDVDGRIFGVPDDGVQRVADEVCHVGAAFFIAPQ